MSKLMDKDEELQLCIQRFVSDTQSMINQFSEMFVREVRRFADVCMEFSIAYRGMQEEKEFLSVENQSLKDELDARTSEVEILGKELRETREENEELSRRLDSLVVNSEGQMGNVLIDSNASRHYAVVNSMPAFPRRYSVAASVASYEGPRSSAEYREPSIDYSSPSPSSPDHISSLPTSTDNHMLTPPTGFITTISLPHGQRSILGEDTVAERKSLSKDDIALYVQLLAQFENSGSDGEPHTTVTNRTPSFDEILAVVGTSQNNSTNSAVKVVEADNLSGQIRALTPAVSSSAGTFYDCVGSSNFDMNTEIANNPQLITVSDQIKRLFSFTSLMYSENDTTSRESKVTTPTVLVNDSEQTELALANQEFDALKKRFQQQLEMSANNTTTNSNNNNQNIDPESGNNRFISKTPSPNAFSYNQHFNTYRSNPHNSDSNLLQNYEDEDDEVLLHLPPVQRINSKKIHKKKLNKRKSDLKDSFKAKPDSFDCVQDDNRECNNLLSQSKWYQTSEVNTDSSVAQFSEFTIPTPRIELNKYLLVEVCHFVSPSHFYLIVNDEKVGSNAFEDFLECFQNFYKSFEDYDCLEDDGEWTPSKEGSQGSREWKIFYSTPPLTQQVLVGSYWACFIDDELDWRRVQVVHHQVRQPNDDTADDKVVVRDVDSGYSNSVLVTMLRPLSEEMACVPAFAIRSSLACIHPRMGVIHGSSVDSIDDLDNWSLECCLLFEKFVYDQILTAYVMNIQSEQLTDTEVAQVLLWCTTKDDEFEVFINRKFIDFNYATNVAEDDSWIELFGDVIPVIAESGVVVAEDKFDSHNVNADKEIVEPVELKAESVRKKSDADGSETKEHKKIKIKSKSKKNKSASSNAPSGKETYEPNQLLMSTTEPRSQVSVVCHTFTDNESTTSQCLHHDPRLSNWIVQKHSRHVTLKKCDKVCYLFRVTCFLDVNKFIGILPFGERKVDLDLIGNFLTYTDETIQSPFRQFLLEMTEYYQKPHDKLKLSGEGFSFEEANNRTIAFYDTDTSLYLRGHIVGKDIDCDSTSIGSKTSKSDKNLPTKLKAECDMLDKKPKSYSVKRRNKSTEEDSASKWIVYAIDIGTYYLVSFDNLYNLDDKFLSAKPFAVACKLNECHLLTFESRCQLRNLIENKLLGLRFIDVDFTTERFTVSLYSLDIDERGQCHAKDIMQMMIDT